MYTKFWQVKKQDEVVNISFVTKKSALLWIADQSNPEEYEIMKVSM
jgi:hypothetical protein